MEIYKVVVIPDTQHPFVSKKSLACAEKYIADERWDEVIHIGDLYDAPYLSKFTDGLPGLVEGQRMKDDFKMINDFLDRIQGMVRKKNPKAKFTLIKANHEVRLDKFMDKYPHLKGMLDLDVLLNAKKRGLKIVEDYPKGNIYKIGKLAFAHGRYTGRTPERRMAENYGFDIAFGHVHSVGSHTIPRWGSGNGVTGYALGCLCDFSLDYIGKNPKAWKHAITTIYFRPNGEYNLYTSVIGRDGFIAPNGKFYAAKKQG